MIYTANKPDTMLVIGVNLVAHLLNKIKNACCFNWYQGSAMRQTKGQSSIQRTNCQSSIQQPGALLKQLLKVYFKKM